MPKIIVIAHNIRSTHNVGSIFRTCEGFGVEKITLSGYTPVPLAIGYDPVAGRLPHVAEKVTRQIQKAALGAEDLVPFEHQETLDIANLKAAGYRLVALEQSDGSIDISNYSTTENIALLLGEEVNGIHPDLLSQCDDTVEIPMRGQKESFNVSVAAGIALYALTT